MNRTYSYQVTATDPEDDVITYGLFTAPEGMTIDLATGLITWLPGTSVLGDHDVRMYPCAKSPRG